MGRRHHQDVTEENNHFFKIPRREKRIKTGKEARVDRRSEYQTQIRIEDILMPGTELSKKTIAMLMMIKISEKDHTIVITSIKHLERLIDENAIAVPVIMFDTIGDHVIIRRMMVRLLNYYILIATPRLMIMTIMLHYGELVTDTTHTEIATPMFLEGRMTITTTDIEMTMPMLLQEHLIVDTIYMGIITTTPLLDIHRPTTVIEMAIITLMFLIQSHLLITPL